MWRDSLRRNPSTGAFEIVAKLALQSAMAIVATIDNTAVESGISNAAHALAAGRWLDVLKLTALRTEPLALAMRATVLAQFGERVAAARLFRRAARKFGSHDATASARCVVAEAEIALVSRDLGWPKARLEKACSTLEQAGDHANAFHARHLVIRHLLVIGHVAAAERAWSQLPNVDLPASLAVAHELLTAQLATRRLRIGDARRALMNAARIAAAVMHPALVAEVASAVRKLEQPAARLVSSGVARLVTLEEIAAALPGSTLVIDVCRGMISEFDREMSLATRPIAMGLARALGEAWPVPVSRDVLVRRVFGARPVDETLRARLRVAVGRLRAVLRGIADIEAVPDGYVLKPCNSERVIALLPPDDCSDTAMLALLNDGRAWSSAALAIALGVSQRKVQRSLDALATRGEVHCVGHARARRWTSTRLSGFTTTMLLPCRQNDELR